MEKKMEKKEEFIDFEHLGKAVKFFRKSRKMTQKELAEKLNKTPYTIKRYEKDGKIPLEVAKEILKYCIFQSYCLRVLLLIFQDYLMKF